MLSINEIYQLAHDQRERMWKQIREGSEDVPEFYSDPEEASIAFIIVNFTANHHKPKDSESKK